MLELGLLELEFTSATLATLINVILIDAVLAVDNAIVMGTAAAKLPEKSRKKAITLGVGAAALFRAAFAVFAVKLLQVPGVSLVGGLMLAWVAFKLWRDLRAPANHIVHKSIRLQEGALLRQAVLQILIADVSMSLDNVLAIAGAAREHMGVMIVGLVFSVLLMGFAANILAKFIQRYRWISYAGVAIIVYVAVTMIVDGAHAVLPLLH